MSLSGDIEARLARAHLDLLATLNCGDETLLLLGPAPRGFWPAFTASPEYSDGAPDPLDRWSKRIIGALARTYGGVAVFPSDGPPYPPFMDWALQSGQCWQSPVGLFVHERAGLMLSFRAALRLPGKTAPPDISKASPCETCADQPCRTACPVDALQADAYDVPACQSHIRDTDSAKCRTGCAARRACPVSQNYGRAPEQSAFHMRAFLKEGIRNS